MLVIDSSKQPQNMQGRNTTREKYMSENNPYPKQRDIGERIAQKIQNQCGSELQKCKYFNFFVLLPKFHSLEQQTITRVKDFIESVQQMSSLSCTNENETRSNLDDSGKMNNLDYSMFLRDIQSGLTSSQVHNHVIRLGTNTKHNKKLNDLLTQIQEDDETLFLIVVDEAHYGTTIKSEFNKHFNDKDISTRKNLIILQVSATPYSLVTKNSRIPGSNRLDWFSEDDKENMYYGIKDFIAATENHVLNPVESNERQDSLCFDEELEKLVQNDQINYSRLVNKELGLKDKATKDAIWRFSRLKLILMQYIGSLINRFKNIIQDRNEFSKVSTWAKELYRLRLDQLIQDCSLTQKSSKIFCQIIHISEDNRILETGKMCLLRVLYTEDGIFVYDTLRKVRQLLGMESTFALIMDCDEKSKRSFGMAEFNRTETPFLERLQKWNSNSNFRARQYVDLQDLPTLLIVVEKGKMGITFPRSLSCYDLRLRYSSNAMVTRTSLEQDLGRVCQYKEHSNHVPEVSIYVSEILYKNIKTKRSRGITSLDPDYVPSNMEKSKRIQIKPQEFYPKHEGDFSSYGEFWQAGKEHYDYKYNRQNKENKQDLSSKASEDGNSTSNENRFLLYGRPQIGKTGAFLHVAFLLWEKMNGPRHVGSKQSLLEVDTDIEDPDCSDEDIADKPTVNKMLVLNSELHPPFDILKDIPLQPYYPNPSPRYGDPKIQEDFDHYIKDGKTYPPERLLLQKQKNVMMKRKPESRNSDSPQHVPNCSHKSDLSVKNLDPVTFHEKSLRRETTNFGSKPLCPDRKDNSRKKNIDTSEYLSRYRSFDFEFGTLYIHKHEVESNKNIWKLTNEKIPKISIEIKLPPIVICSSGRSNGALLDLEKGMPDERYVEVVVIHKEEEEMYMQLTKNYPKISVFVIPYGKLQTIGTTRHHAKLLAEKIIHIEKNPLVFFMDDNIRKWDGIVLLNDPNPLPFLSIEPEGQSCAQEEEIPLGSVLRHFEEKKEDMSKFTMIGFQMSKRNLRNRKIAYGRKHVFTAFILNMHKTKEINYTEQAWAMEDIDFNFKVNKLWNSNRENGVIVKCQRFIASKKKLDGGIIPKDVPPQIEELLKTDEDWKTSSIVRSKRRKQNLPNEYSQPKRRNPVNVGDESIEREIDPQIS